MLKLYIVTRARVHTLARHGALISIFLLAVLSSLAFVHLNATAVGEDTETLFTIAQVPDTQNEVMADGTPLLTSRYQWLVDNKDALNLKFIAHTGDVVNWGVADPVQFTRADAATTILDNSGIPFSYAIGNHDTAAVTVGGSAAPGVTRDNLRNTSLFNQTFPVTRFANVVGEFEAGKVDNMFQTFHAGGIDWLVLTHEMWPRQAVIDWMKQVVQTYSTYNVIVSTHAFIDGTGALPTSGFYGDTTALSEWNQFISQYPNIRMVISGHYGPTDTTTGAYYLTRTGVNGNKIAQILTAYHSNYQDHVRLLKIDTANQTLSSSVYVSASTSSSYPTGYITDTYSNFVETDMNWLGGGNQGGSIETVPGAPYAVMATAGVNSATVSFSAPLTDGGSPVTNYTVTSNPGNITASGTNSPIVVTGLMAGTSYTFTVTATNAIGTSAASAVSNVVTPYASTPSAPELLSDPGFELGTTGGWVPFNVGTFSLVTSPVYGGSKALSISTTTTTSQLVGMMQTSAMTSSTAGKTYNFSCYVRPSVSGRNMVIRLLEYTQNYSSNVKIGTVTATSLPSSDWTHLKVSGVSTTSGRRIIPQIYSNNQTASTGVVYYDNCSFTAGDATSVPDAPTITGVTAGAGSATVSFAPPVSSGTSPVTSYVVTSSPGGITATGAASPITVTGLTNGTSYTFTVKAVSDVGSSVASTPSVVVVPATFPGVPRDLSSVVASASTVSLAWNTPVDTGGSPITDYEVWYRPVGSSSWDEFVDGISSATTAIVSGLDTSQSYEFFVAAVNAVGSGTASTIATSQPYIPPTVPDAPQTVTAVAGNTSATVSFVPPANNGGTTIVNYVVTSVPGGLTVTGSSSPITVTGLNNGTSYTFTVVAVNEVGSSVASEPSNSVIPATVPDAPTGLVAVSGDATASLSWVAPASDGGAAVSGYSVWYRSVGSANWLAFTHVSSDTYASVVTGLDNTKGYEFYVTAENAVGSSAASNIVITEAFQPIVLMVPSEPQNVTATAMAGAAIVSFDIPLSDGNSPITRYTVVSSPGNIAVSGSGSPITVVGLINGVSYTFTVTATNAIGTSVASSASNAVVPKSVDLLPDPDFELGTTSGWKPFNVGTFSLVTNPVVSGSKALSISTTTTTSQLVGMMQTSAMTSSTAGKTYNFSCYVRPSVSGRNMIIRLLQYTQNYSSNLKIGTVQMNKLSSSSWTYMEVSGIATASGMRIIPQIYAINQTASTGVVYYDNCSFTVN